ncbi:MAG TPA: hypothetical protein PLM93_09300 [Sulfuricurvum sp.]|nr:MAG: hypothetical protein B7Y30_07385 [Campylobacterales bacterium 16-40-21]OZA02465.1 MAG: hypothetical protein B7X89_08980 [Sulfuricurvum sp. 17-40-25]HQS67363.1 hypothetical protein [Sulfuricurvum sp.]HQT36114.1 hypothetical protein [Sulfuricurvum sp.]
MSMNPAQSSLEYLELKALLLQQQALFKMFIPVKASIAHLANMTGKSRQAIRQYLIAHFEPEVDFWVENGKIYASKETAAQIISRGAR